MVVPLRKDCTDRNKFRKNSPDSENPDALPLWITYRKGQVRVLRDRCCQTAVHCRLS